MDNRVERLKTPEECLRFAKNVEAQHPVLAREARRRAVDLRAKAYGAKTEAEHEAIQAVYAYEAVLTSKNRKTTRANRTWQMIRDHGILPAVERAVNRTTETAGFNALAEMGLLDYAFESVILRHETLFTPEAVEISKQRLEGYKKNSV